MANSLILGIRIKPNNFQRYTVQNVDLESKVYLLKEEAAKLTKTETKKLELLFCGNVLDDESSLSSNGIKPGVMIHVLSKKNTPTPAPSRVFSEAEVQQLIVAFRAFTLSPGYRVGLQKLSRPEVLENIIAATPGLIDDPVAIAMIQDPDLNVHMQNADTVRRIAELHPCLIEAANYIAAHILEEGATANHTQAGTSTGYSYSLDDLSDDEDMDSSSSDPPREGHTLTRNSSYNAITAAQLAAAIANATNNFTATGSFMPSTNQPISSGNVITNEMFSNAMQQAFASATPTNSSSPGEETLDSIRNRLQPQLQQMREIGLNNEDVNIRALQATSGDVQAAIELVFNGVID